MPEYPPYRLSELATYLGADCQGDADRLLEGMATLQSATHSDISFLSNPRYRPHLSTTAAGAVLVDRESSIDCRPDCLVCDDPYMAFARLTHLFDRQPRLTSAIAASADIDSSAELGEGVSVGAHVVIGAGASIGSGASIGPGCHVGRGTQIGAGTRLMANVSIYHDVRIGSDCLFHSGAVIGSDGFGHAPIAGARVAGREGQANGDEQQDGRAHACWQKIAQLGGVLIGDRVEIGANTTVDRGALDDTVIEDDVIIDNQVQVAHNVIIGRGTAIAGCVGIAGSATIGRHCNIGGGAGIAGHLKIADGTTVLGMTLINRSVKEPGIYASGTGMQDAASWRKSAVRFTQLEQMSRRIKTLEQCIQRLDTECRDKTQS